MSAGFASIAEKWAQELKAKDKQKDETEETKNDESKGKKSVESEELKSNKEDKDDGLKEWWYLSGPDGRRNKKKGPATWKQVCKLGNPTQQHIWKEGMERWMTLAECKLIANGDAWYYIDISGGQQGPMSKWDLVNRAVTDQVKAETMIWKHGTAISWLPANQIEDLRLACGFKKPKDLPQQTENMDTDEPAPAATPDQELEWYWEDQYREKQGPVNKPELIMMLEREKIADQTLVWKAGMDDWVTLHEALFGRKVEQSVAPVAKDENEEENVEDIRHRLVKEVALTEECDPNSKVLGTVAQLTIVKILEAKDERVKVEAPKLTGWCKAEDEDGPLIERVKAKDLVKKRKRKKKRKWKDVQAPAVYVQGFPPDITVKEIEEYFKKCGNIKRDILTGHLKIKLYEDPETKKPKGDGVVHFFQPESVLLAVKLLDGADIRPGVKIQVSPAEFKQKGDYKAKKKQKLTKAQRNVMREVYKAYSSVSWEEDPDKVAPQLRIVILKGMFTLEEVADAPSPEYFYETLKLEVGMECERVGGVVEKVTIFKNTPEGIIAVKFAKPSGSAACIDVMNNRWFARRRVECVYWDGETDYRVKETEEEEEARLEAFGKELDAQKVPLPD